MSEPVHNLLLPNFDAASVVPAGLGLNAYFAYNVVGYMGSGSVSYGAALAAVFLEGWVFLLLSVTGIRAKLFTYVPGSIRLGMTAGGPLRSPSACSSPDASSLDAPCSWTPHSRDAHHIND